MTALVKQIQRKTNSRWVGWTGTVLIDELVKDAVMGRNFAYKACLFKKDQLPFSEEMLGKEVNARIMDFTSSTLRAVVQSFPEESYITIVRS
jgi:tRNA A37 methylthiotransferase MiaB